MAAFEVIRARALGTCFGVRDAIELALQDRFRGRLTVLGDLVHNRHVLARLDANEVARVAGFDADVATDAVMITAHGTSDAVRERVRARGLEVHDATCPLVEKVHRTARRLAAAGWHVAVFGKKGHVEVEGLTGDLEDFSIVQGESELDALRGRKRVAFVAQTTETTERFRRLVGRARALLEPEGATVIAHDTTCQPTRDRQAALRELCATCDVILVVGDPTSNNSRKLAETARALGVEAYRVGGADEIRPEWLAGKARCGITAGTSTPDEKIDEVERALRHLAGASICV